MYSILILGSAIFLALIFVALTIALGSPPVILPGLSVVLLVFSVVVGCLSINVGKCSGKKNSTDLIEDNLNHIQILKNPKTEIEPKLSYQEFMGQKKSENFKGYTDETLEKKEISEENKDERQPLNGQNTDKLQLS